MSYGAALREILALLGPGAGAGPGAARGDAGERTSGLMPRPLNNSEAVPVPEQPRLQRLLQDILEVLARSGGFSRGGLLVRDEESGAISLLALAEDGERPQLSVGQKQCPELRDLLRAGQPAPLASNRERALLAGLLTGARSSEGAMLVVPLPDLVRERPGDSSACAFLLHADAPHGSLAGPDGPTAEFLAIAAQVTALGLRGRHLADFLRDRTRRVTLPRQAEERRREAVLQYREFFESSADGIMVLDEKGRVHYLNRSAQQMTGYATYGLAGRSIADFVPESQRDGLTDVLRQVLSQVGLLPFDLQLVTTSGEVLVLSVSTSSVLAEHGCAVLSFRDVTEQRILEHELRKTKEFLERLIDSTVDGIIAADMEGNVILFNQGAARITGYSPEEVLGKLPVWRLYPSGDARMVMAQLRSGDHSGPGRLQQARRTILGKNGVEVPVSLTASIIYEDDREVATVGILSDLRERLNIEKRLQQAQEALKGSEKQALIAELAGTAAHELNQPLTSVMGYAGLLRRKLPADGAELLEFVDIVVREAERMAEIVRKIGRITRYETKPYVGESRIIDLDKSAVPEPIDAPAPALILKEEGS